MIEQEELFPKIYSNNEIDVFVDREGDDQRIFVHDKATDVYHQRQLASQTDEEVVALALSWHSSGWLIDQDTVLWYNSLSRR